MVSRKIDKLGHTPGPWHKGVPPAMHTYVFDERGAAIVESANSRDVDLIAAAPDLLAALERLAFAAECRDNTSGDQARLIAVRAELSAAASEARNVIAKAKGGRT